MTAATLHASEAPDLLPAILGVYQGVDSRVTTPLGYERSGNTPMGKRSQTGGITAVGTRRIRFDFFFEGQRYRPSILRAPTDMNLRRARDQLAGIKERIATGTFSSLMNSRTSATSHPRRIPAREERAVTCLMPSSHTANPAWPKMTWHRSRSHLTAAC